VTGIARIGDRSVGGGDRSLVAGFDRGYELTGSALHLSDQLLDMPIGGKDLRFHLAFRHIGAGRKQGSVEGGRQRGDGFRCADRIRAQGSLASDDAANVEIERTAHPLHRVLAPRECCLAVLG